MNDLTWVERTMVVQHGDVAKDALEDNDGWHLLHVTGGLHGPIEFVYGWGDPPEEGETLLFEGTVVDHDEYTFDDYPTDPDRIRELVEAFGDLRVAVRRLVDDRTVGLGHSVDRALVDDLVDDLVDAQKRIDEIQEGS